MLKRINFTSKFALTLLAAGALVMGGWRYQQYKNQRAVLAEENSIKTQIASLEQKNQQLSDSLTFLNSSSFKDQVARGQLNLKKQGEIVFGFTSAANPQPNAPSQPDKPNYEKWLQYFFDK
ncbi:MAG: septum formation initiator family protein [Patescibacteria group bacterium]|nr:septum formation initiator family protein [Patescibacteria group bacterium]